MLNGDLEPEEVLAELSLEGTKALEGGSYSPLSDGGTTAAATSGEAVTGDAEESATSPSVARSLFGFSGKGGGRGGRGGRGKGPRARAKAEDAEGEGEGESLDDAPVVPSKEETELQSRCTRDMLRGAEWCLGTTPARLSPPHKSRVPNKTAVE